MILVEIEVPVMEKTYDFQIDENSQIYKVIQEVENMICIKEQFPLGGNRGVATLWDAKSRQRIPMDKTAGEVGIKNGWKLIFV